MRNVALKPVYSASQAIIESIPGKRDRHVSAGAPCFWLEREEGMMGFFDEGVVVGKCVECGQEQAFVYTD